MEGRIFEILKFSFEIGLRLEDKCFNYLLKRLNDLKCSFY